MTDNYVLVGYFRFIESDKPGVVGEVISHYSEGWAEDSTVPVYRRPGETKATRQATPRKEHGTDSRTRSG